MAAGPQISQQKILAASQGDSAALLEVLQQMAQVSTQQQAVTGTTPTSTPANQVSPAARIPAQATGSVSILGGSYIVQIVNPGGTSPLSQLQAAQQASTATSVTPLQPVTPIYHQIRVSTSPAFNVNSNTQTFGGNTGSTQTYWTLTGLGTGTFYVQFRSSFDGINFNQWKNANGGTALGGLINEVTLETVGDADWALFTLPGKMITGTGSGVVADKSVFDLPTGVYSSGLIGIAGPNGYVPKGNSAYGVTECTLSLQQPTTGLGATGILDYPVIVNMEYGQAHAAPNFWPGNASVFAIAFDPTNPNVTITDTGTTSWAVMKLPGGAQIAFGQGLNNDGDTLLGPPTTWFSWANSMSISSFTGATDTGNTPWGFNTNQIVGGVLSAKYADASNIWSTPATWMAIAWQPGTDVQTVNGFPFLQIQLQGGHAVMLGAGQALAGASIQLPAGFTSDQMLSICTPAGFVPSGHHFQGISQCSMVGLTPVLTYLDDSGNVWSGPCNWMVACWT